MSDTAQISEIALKDLDPRLRKHYENAEKNLARNPAFTVDLCMGVLQKQPGAVEFRALLRQAQMRIAGTKTGGLGKFMKSVSRAPFAMKGSSQLKKAPEAALQTAEKMIGDDPHSVAGYKLLGEAAMALGMKRTAVLAYEGAREADPASLEIGVALGNAYIESGQPKEAIRVGDELLRDHSGNEQAADLVRRASVAQTMDKGKWEEEGDFRDKLADEEKAIELEQAARVAKDEDSLRALVTRATAEIEKSPEDIKIYRQLINAHKSLHEYQIALDWTRKARAIPLGHGDPTLERLEGELEDALLNEQVEKQRAEVEDHPDDAAAQDKLKELEKQQVVFRLKSAEDMVDKYPNDFHARYNLGQLYLEAERPDEAIRELQLAQRNPQVRTRAILLTGRAMLSKGMGDLAITQLKTAKSEAQLMNDLRKEIIYDLAQAYEINGDAKAAIEEYKEIYQADISYRDVADKINEFYSKK